MDAQSIAILQKATSTHFPKNRYAIYIKHEAGNNVEAKKVIGIRAIDEKINNYFAVSEIYESIINLNKNISVSFDFATKGIQAMEESAHIWTPMCPISKEEDSTLYFIENIVFRTSILWDLLAQLYNVYWGCGIATDSIHCRKFFNNRERRQKNETILDYINKKEDEMEREAHFEYVKAYRNKLTHRISPHVTSFSKYWGTQIREHPLYIICRVAADYLYAVSFINEVLNLLDRDILNCQTSA